MTTVTVSSKYQVVIPLEARQALGIQPGQKIEVIAYDGRLEFILVDKPKTLRGFLRGIDTAVPRDKDRLLNVVDSSAWLEYFADGENARHFARPIEDPQNLIVPAICLLEVFKRVLQQRNETDALKVAAAMRQGQLVDLDAELALTAAQLGIAHRLRLADSVIYATARRFDATLWTQDGDFEGLAAVRYFAKRST